VQLPPGAPTERIVVESDGGEFTATGDSVLGGKVTIRQGSRTLTAHDASYDARTQAFRVTGGVEYGDPLLHLSGEAATWESAGGGEFSHSAFEIPSRPARGSAESIRLAADGRLQLDRVVYTACPAGHRDWSLHAQRIDIDRAAEQGTGRNVRLDFKGVPLLYLPIISFPVGDARKSGFLFPGIGDSMRNAVEIPYYLNLAPNYDATLTPGFLTQHGATLGTEFRYLTGTSRGEFHGDYLPHDSRSGGERAHLRFGESSDLSERLRFDTALEYASDSSYFEDFGIGTEGTSVAYLQRLARLTYLDSHWRAVALAEQFQTIDQTIAAADRPYARAPQLLVRGRWVDASGPGFALSGEAVNFTRDVGAQGARLSLEPAASWAWRGPGAYVEPTVAWHATRYELREGSGDRSPAVAAPVATLDAGLDFERTSGTRLQTLEPRLLYTWIPYRDQSALPVFDTALPDLNLVQLFRTQRYVGGDRLGDANQLAFGATTRLVDEASGKQLFSATLGQIYYRTPPRVRLPDEPAITARGSDIVAQAAVSAWHHWNVNVGEEWSTQQNRATLTEVRVQYHPAANEVANLAYRFRRGLLEQLDGSAAWPVAAAWNLYARHVYSLRDRAAIESFGGFEYRACCWRVRLVARRYVGSFTGARTTSISLQWELSGLSNVGEKANAFLERSIRGYSAAAPGTPFE
jgi:LPS-assembly protein